MITAKEAKAQADKFSAEGYAKTMADIEGSIESALRFGDYSTKAYVKDSLLVRVKAALESRGFRVREMGRCDDDDTVGVVIDWR